MIDTGYITICTDEVNEGDHCIHFDRCGNPDKSGKQYVSYALSRKPSYTEISNIKSSEILKYFAVDNGCCCRMFPCSQKECDNARIYYKNGPLKALVFNIHFVQ